MNTIGIHSQWTNFPCTQQRSEPWINHSQILVIGWVVMFSVNKSPIVYNFIITSAKAPSVMQIPLAMVCLTTFTLTTSYCNCNGPLIWHYECVYVCATLLVLNMWLTEKASYGYVFVYSSKATNLCLYFYWTWRKRRLIILLLEQLNLSPKV